MMKSKAIAAWVCGLMVLWLAGCSKPSGKDIEIKTYALDSLDGLIQQSGVEIDTQTKAEGSGSLKITVSKPSVIRLFETGDIDIEDAALVYQAKLRTEGAEGNVYLEMWCHFEGKGEFFSRGLDNPLKGTMDWTTQEISFFLKVDENPDNVKLNVISEGPGTVWIDNIRLLKRAQ
jgi:hypothetical protein